MRVGAVILAAGKGERFGGDKLSETLQGKPVWQWSLDAYRTHPHISDLVVVASDSNMESLRGLAGDIPVIRGGQNRQESSLLGTAAIDTDLVMIHDAARPFVDSETIGRVIVGAVECGACAAAVPVVDTLRSGSGQNWSLIDRNHTRAMQTPQAARREWLLDSHQKATSLFTDEMELVGNSGYPFCLVEGSEKNFKITTQADLEHARAMVERMEYRTGIGYDIHRFSTDAARPLFLGGVRFEGTPGLDGHSDADVVIHAAVDALLGAAAKGDIGVHFPNTDARWQGAASLIFLEHARDLLTEAGWQVSNLDITLIGEKPKVMPRADEIRSALAHALGVDRGRIGFKATTNERLGSLGRAEGLAAYAVATIRR